LFRGFIDEKIYEYPEDPEETVAKILKLPVDEILKRSEELIAPWPNTYTFTKNLCERALAKNRGSLPVLILRPAIIICSYEEPYAGWTDSMAAAGTLTMMVASGMTKYLVGNDFVRADIIPVDQVANAIIVGTAFQAGNNSLSVQHSSSSHPNPITWRQYCNWFLDYARTSPFEFQ
jgi:fatty acyl-CoA reductase